MASDTDTDSDSEGEFTADYEMFDGGIKPFSFEPEYTPDEIVERRERKNRLANNKKAMNEGNSSIDWCYCSICAYDESIYEDVCCRNPKILPNEKFAGHICITNTSSFSSICLNKDVLEVALEGWNDMRGDNKEYKNENYRFIAYRQFIWWCHGHMGKKNRTPLPNCVLRKIREIFPDPNNFYIPYCED